MSKVLGEAIYLLEPDDLEDRVINLPYEFDPPTGDRLSLPSNLHILGTMNTSDRSLAIVDIAIRRRFSFIKLWPQMSVVDSEGCDLMRQAFQNLLSIFVDHATQVATELVPGHSYFLESDERRARRRLRTTLKPLLEDYLQQGYVSSFAESVRSPMDRFVVSPFAEKVRRRRRHQTSLSLDLPARFETRCFDAVDSATNQISARFLLRGQPSRDPTAQIARLADEFIKLNRFAFGELDLTVSPRYQSGNIDLNLETGTRIGAIPLLSPTSGRHDYGIVVRPRFDWPGIGPILGATGWRLIPTPLPLPLLPNSERRVPPWVLSTIVLSRLKGLLDQVQRRFESTSTELSSPRGTINWSRYLQRQIGRAQFLEVPCTFPELQKDRELRSAIRFALEKQLRSLQTQSAAGSFVRELLELCRDLINQVRDVNPREPLPTTFQAWRRGSLQTDVFRRGLEAIEWTADERGLGGLSDLTGLPWVMSMEQLFEARVETLMSRVVRRIGGTIRSGRKRETVVPLNWDPPYRGSQKSLVPDLIIERDDTTVIVDAKYKEHWEEMQQRRWADLEENLGERHRADLLQILAYSSVARTPKVLVCLAYPCSEERWLSLRARKLLIHRASLPLPDRRLALALIAFPLSTRVVSDVVAVMTDEITRVAA